MYKPRDYSKPMMVRLNGEKGLKAYISLLKTPAVKYDAKKASKEALENIRRQGINI